MGWRFFITRWCPLSLNQTARTRQHLTPLRKQCRLPQARVRVLRGTQNSPTINGEMQKAPNVSQGPCESPSRRRSSREFVLFVRSRLVMIFPVAIRVPLMIVAVPPSVIRVPATIPFRVQIAPSLVRLVAAFAVLANCLVKSCFPLFDFPLALGMIVSVHLGHRHQRGRA